MSIQVEDGHTRIANKILEALASLKISNYESRFLFALFRKTYGYQKKDDYISLSQFSQITGIDPQHIARTKKKLLNKKIIYVKNKQIGFNKAVHEWVLPKQVLPKQVAKTTQTGSKKLPKQVDTKERKKLIQKKGEVKLSADSFFSSFNSNEKEMVVLKSNKFDVRPKDVVYCALQANEWCNGKEFDKNTWVWWDSFFNRWIIRALRRHELSTLSDKKEKEVVSKKKKLTKAQLEEKKFLESINWSQEPEGEKLEQWQSQMNKLLNNSTQEKQEKS